MAFSSGQVVFHWFSFGVCCPLQGGNQMGSKRRYESEKVRPNTPPNKSFATIAS